MVPVLYETMTEGTVPTHYGLGPLNCLRCEVSEERNGKYELVLEYAAEGIHADDIQVNRFIMAKPNFTDNPQIFRIYKVSKTMNGKFTVNAQHISYDLSGKVISTGTAGSCTAACLLLEASAGNFTITTDKTVSADFVIKEPSSVRSWFGGKQGSLLDVYGTAEWYYDNYACSLKLNRGMDRGVQIRYGKNLTALSQEIDMSNLCTGVIPYYIDDETNTKVVGAKVSTGLVLDVDRDQAVDFSSDVDPESATPIATQLATLASNYITNNIFTRVFSSITLDFVQMGQLKDRVDLCDTVHIFFEPLGISVALKCVATVWDVLQERYIQTTFGDSRNSIADTIVNQQQALKETVDNVSTAIERATDLITGNLGGYVVMHDTNADGKPDEILIMDTEDINTAVNVIRMNQAGIGLSTTGYAGPYTTAVTASGIVADVITTGVLNASLIKAGVISDVAGNSQIDMTTGIAKLWSLIATGNFTVKDDNTGDELAKIYRTTNGTALLIKNRNVDTVITAQVGENDEGLFSVRNGSGYETVLIDGENGHIEQKNGIVELANGPFYSGTRVPWGPYSAYMIWGQLTSSGSNIAFTVPKTMITTTNQKFIINDEVNYSTYLLAYDDVNDELVITWNTASQGAGNQRINKVYGIY